MIERNVFGELEYSIGKFSVTHRKNGHGKYEITRREPWYATSDIYMTYGNMFLWDKCPKFDSFIHAVRYLKKNVDYLF